MTSMNFSSGDLVADRRADYASALSDSGDHVAAAELLAQALELAPGWAAGWFQYATCLERAGNFETARSAFAQVLRLSPDDIFGATMKLAALGGDDAPAKPPRAYVERLFDDYAGRFDAALLQGLGYTIPQRLEALIAQHQPGSFAKVADLGCGTGLMGERLRMKASYIAGYDLSAGMLAKAQEKGIYDRLIQADLAADADDWSIVPPSIEDDRADLVTAADVFMYFGDLDTVFQTVAKLSRNGALFAFSVEDADRDMQGDWSLRPSLRFAHSEAYVRATLARHAFEPVTMTREPIRRDGADEIIGLLTLARFMPAETADLTTLSSVSRKDDPHHPLQ